MKLKIWSKKPAENADSKQLFLRLVYNNKHEKDIDLRVVNKEGNPVEDGQILIIDTDNKVLILSYEMDGDLGLKTDFIGTPLCYHPKERKELANLVRPSSSDFMQVMLKGIAERQAKEKSNEDE